MSLSGIPCEHEWLFMSDVAYERYSGTVDSQELYKAFRSFLQCPACGNLFVHWDGWQGEATEYAPIKRPAH